MSLTNGSERRLGDARFRLPQEGKVLQEKTMPTNVAALGSDRIAFAISISQQPANYQVEATLLATPAGPVRSVRDFSVRSLEQREARRNLAAGPSATASSEGSSSFACGVRGGREGRNEMDA